MPAQLFPQLRGGPPHVRILKHVSLPPTQITLSWYPLVPIEPDMCVLPRVDVLSQQIIIFVCTAWVGVPTSVSLYTIFLLPGFMYLDWRYVSLNSLPGGKSISSFLLRRALPHIFFKVKFEKALLQTERLIG